MARRTSRSPGLDESGVGTAASPELIDYYNQRSEPLFQALMDRPELLADVPLAEIQPLSGIHGSAHPWRALEPVELLQSAGRWADAAAMARSVEDRQPPGEEGAQADASLALSLEAPSSPKPSPTGRSTAAELTASADAVTSAAADLEASTPGGVQDGQLRSTLDGLLASARAAEAAARSRSPDPAAAADELDRPLACCWAHPPTHRVRNERGSPTPGRSPRCSSATTPPSEPPTVTRRPCCRRPSGRPMCSAPRSAQEGATVPEPRDLHHRGRARYRPGAAQAAWQRLALFPPPVSLVGTSLFVAASAAPRHASAGAGTSGLRRDDARRPVTDILVVRPRELYHLGMTVRLVSAPEWAKRCIVEPVTTLGREALALPRYELSLSDGTVDEFGITLTGEGPLHCSVEQPILGPALDCPIQVRLIGGRARPGDRDRRIPAPSSTALRPEP